MTRKAKNHPQAPKKGYQQTPFLQLLAGNESPNNHFELSSAPPINLEFATQGHLSALESDQPAETYVERQLQVIFARHLAALDLGHAAETAAMAASGPPIHSMPQASLAPFRMPVVRDVLQYQTSHERRLLAVTKKLERLTKPKESRSRPRLPILFTSEEECRDHIMEWQLGRPWVCPSCGDAKRYLLTGRPTFESSCGQQFPAYQGTVFVGSHVPLLDWSHVITHVMLRPQLTARQIAKDLTTKRIQTIRETITAVQIALASPDANQQLGGLNLVILLKVVGDFK